MLRISGFYDSSCTNGEGWRSVIFLSGCPHKCKGCHNPSTWDFCSGEHIEVAELTRRILSNRDFIDGITLSGGEPFQKRYIDDLITLIDNITKYGLNIWCYTGYLYEDLVKYSEYSKLLDKIDVLIDGPFVQELYNPDLKFKGSSNQRIINLKTHRNTDNLTY